MPPQTGVKPRHLLAWPCALLAGSAGILIYLFIYVWRRTYHEADLADFLHFFTAAKAMVHGQNPYEVMAPGSPRPGYIYPPLIAFLYSPLARFLQIGAAARVSLACNTLAIAAGFWVGARAMLERFGQNLKAFPARATTAIVILLALLLTLDKVKGELQMLQTNALIFAAFAIALWYLDRRPWIVGMTLGFALNIKYQTLVMLPYLLLRRRWKAAGWMAVWTVIWGLLPALLVGFSTELRYLRIAFGGILRLIGINPGPGIAADVEGIRAGFSVSITSAVARELAALGSPRSPMVFAACIGVAWLLLLAIIYKIHRVACLKWPPAKQQSAEPFRRWIALEWMLIIGTTLCFSPQTNTRHLVLAGLITLGALAMVAVQSETRRDAAHRFRIPPRAWPAIAGILILWAGITLPPGHRTPEPRPATSTPASPAAPQIALQDPSVAAWHSIGGPSWAMLAAMALITWSAVSVPRDSQTQA